MSASLKPVTRGFADLPVRADAPAGAVAKAGDIAVIGVPYVSPYPGHGGDTSAAAPAAIRHESLRYAKLDHYDVDFDGPLFAGRAVAALDWGDVVPAGAADGAYGEAVTATVRAALDGGAVPIVLGGDHGATIPVLRAYAERGPLCVVQIDAHLDWIDARGGVRDGYSSPMRRAAEMPWASALAQIGLRGQGSARQAEVDAARAYGRSALIGAAALHRDGMAAVLRRIPAAPSYYLTIDADGLDPAIAPGVAYPTPGGVTYYQAFELMRGLAARGRLVGVDFVEVVPERDVAGLTSLFGARLLLNFAGILAHTGQIGRAPARPATGIRR